MKIFPLVCSKYLSSWTGLGRSGHVRFPTFGPISHVSGPKPIFLGNFHVVLHGFARRSQKTHYLNEKRTCSYKNDLGLRRLRPPPTSCPSHAHHLPPARPSPVVDHHRQELPTARPTALHSKQRLSSSKLLGS